MATNIPRQYETAWRARARKGGGLMCSWKGKMASTDIGQNA